VPALRPGLECGDDDADGRERGVIARGGFVGFASAHDVDYDERDRRIDARDRARSRCEDLAPKCSNCGGHGVAHEFDPDGRWTGRHEDCEACDGTGVGHEPPAVCTAVITPAVSIATPYDFGDDELPF
jgi:hypothetical protein